MELRSVRLRRRATLATSDAARRCERCIKLIAFVCIFATSCAIADDLPSVSIIMPTSHRPELALHALRQVSCLEGVDIVSEVVVIDDSPRVHRISPLDCQRAVGNGTNCRLITLDEPQSIGYKRNLAVTHARGEIIMHADDDDLYACQRILSQLAPIADGSADVVVFEHEWTYFAQDDELYLGSWGPHFGTLAWRRSLFGGDVRFPDTSSGEDYAFAQRAVEQAGAVLRVISSSMEEQGRGKPLFVCVRHGFNTWEWQGGERPRMAGRRVHSAEMPALLRTSDLAFFSTLRLNGILAALHQRRRDALIPNQYNDPRADMHYFDILYREAAISKGAARVFDPRRRLVASNQPEVFGKHLDYSIGSCGRPEFYACHRDAFCTNSLGVDATHQVMQVSPPSMGSMTIGETCIAHCNDASKCAIRGGQYTFSGDLTLTGELTVSIGTIFRVYGDINADGHSIFVTQHARLFVSGAITNAGTVATTSSGGNATSDRRRGGPALSASMVRCSKLHLGCHSTVALASTTAEELVVGSWSYVTIAGHLETGALLLYPSAYLQTSASALVTETLSLHAASTLEIGGKLLARYSPSARQFTLYGSRASPAAVGQFQLIHGDEYAIKEHCEVTAWSVSLETVSMTSGSIMMAPYSHVSSRSHIWVSSVILAPFATLEAPDGVIDAGNMHLMPAGRVHVGIQPGIIVRGVLTLEPSFSTRCPGRPSYEHGGHCEVAGGYDAASFASMQSCENAILNDASAICRAGGRGNWRQNVASMDGAEHCSIIKRACDLAGPRVEVEAAWLRNLAAAKSCFVDANGASILGADFSTAWCRGVGSECFTSPSILPEVSHSCAANLGCECTVPFDGATSEADCRCTLLPLAKGSYVARISGAPPSLPPSAPIPPLQPLSDLLASLQPSIIRLWPIAEQRAEQVASAALELRLLLQRSEVDMAVLRSATNFLSGLMDALPLTTEVPTAQLPTLRAATQEMQLAIAQLVDALVGPSIIPPNPNVALQRNLNSARLNLTLAARPTPDLAGEPIKAMSADGIPIEVAMPPELVGELIGVSAAEPILAVLYTVERNLFGPLEFPLGEPDVLSGSLRIAALLATKVSQFVTFELRQTGRVLTVQNLLAPINVSIPFTPSHAARDSRSTLCTVPGNSTNIWEGCTHAIECRFWDKHRGGFWSTAGCATILQEGAVICQCNHLTDFVIFEFPTSPEALLVTVLDSAKMGEISDRAWQCAFDPSRSINVPITWAVSIAFSLLLILLILNAVRRDRAELDMMEGLAQGQKFTHVRKLARFSLQMKRKVTSAIFPCGKCWTDRALGSSTGSSRVQSMMSVGARSEMPTGADAHSEMPAGVTTRTLACSPVQAPHRQLCLPPRAMSDGSPLKTGVLQKRAGHVAMDDATGSGNEAATVEAEESVSKGKARWRVANKRHRQQELARRWYGDVNTFLKRLHLSCLSSHTLCSGIFYRGAPGYTRAQTVMVLINSLWLETVLVCAFYSPPSDGSMVINPISILVGGTISALIVIPGSFFFAWLFRPIIFVRAGKQFARALLYGPRAIHKCWRQRIARARRVAPDVGVAVTASRTRVAADTSGEKASSRSGLASDPELRNFSQESVQKTLATASLLRMWRQKNYPALRTISFGWLCNLSCFTLMMLVFCAYGCEFFEDGKYRDPNGSQHGNPEELTITWIFSVVQRFLLNEPILILASRGMPRLFESLFCASCFGETTANVCAVMCTSLIQGLRQLSQG